ncbi:hypothetical protein XELAEV_18024828mg [Xenopus laevis]|uniref:Uncharacterized protein n=1 Tax=Xenopus laevis TaxID=8355 RepID=A0A974HLA0_XENLA|nr:hypothetical protein XELAEV_18024828mg [Xenopus laevis]
MLMAMAVLLLSNHLFIKEYNPVEQAPFSLFYFFFLYRTFHAVAFYFVILLTSHIAETKFKHLLNILPETLDIQLADSTRHYVYYMLFLLHRCLLHSRLFCSSTMCSLIYSRT